MKTRSCKSKGRRLQNYTCSRLRDLFSGTDLYENRDLLNLDIKPAIMGESGIDIKLSGNAWLHFPFDIECKNCERWNVPMFWNQCLINTGTDRKPMLILKRNHSDTLCVVRFSDMLELYGNYLSLSLRGRNTDNIITGQK